MTGYRVVNLIILVEEIREDTVNGILSFFMSSFGLFGDHIIAPTFMQFLKSQSFDHQI